MCCAAYAAHDSKCCHFVGFVKNTSSGPTNPWNLVGTSRDASDGQKRLKNCKTSQNLAILRPDSDSAGPFWYSEMSGFYMIFHVFLRLDFGIDF